LCDEWLSCCASVPVFSVECNTKGAAFLVVGVPASCTLGVSVGAEDSVGVHPIPAKAAPPISATFPSGPRRFGESSSRFFSNFGTLGMLAKVYAISEVETRGLGKRIGQGTILNQDYLR
jgi:hypothetical protein